MAPKENAMDQVSLKKAAAESAADQVQDGMIVGLGTGSTAKFAVDALGHRVKAGLKIVGIPTSERTAAQATELGIPLGGFDKYSHIDLSIDGADEVQHGTLHLIKGLGGALLREKIVASATRRFIIIVDESKLVDKICSHCPIPVEVVGFGWQLTAKHLNELGANPVLRMGADGKPFISDGGHYILDCKFDPMVAALPMAREIDHVLGVVEHGLFLGMASEIRVGTPEGVKVINKSA
jgi:ribose 5-phosphate isomerase A